MRRLRAAVSASGTLAATVMVMVMVMVAPCSAQSAFAARLSEDTVEVGEEFSLLVRVPVPAGSLVHFPDTVARTDFLESHGTVRWQAEPDASGGAVLVLDYPVLAFGVGVVPVPGFDVFVQPAAGGAGGASVPGATISGASIPGGSFVGPWDDAPADGTRSARPLRVPRRGIWVNPVFTPEQVEVGVQPMPSADVIGPSWHRPSVLVGLGFLLLLTLLLARAAPAWLERGRLLAGDGGRSSWTPEESRLHALDELARLAAEGLAARGSMHELYTRSSRVVREYVARVRPEYGPHLTSSELMNRLDLAGQASQPAIVREMDAAEVVKFGRLRPERVAAEAHLQSLRSWLEEPGSSMR